MRDIMNEHLMILKLNPSSSKESIQRMQQTIDKNKYGAEEYRRTRMKITTDEFKKQYGKDLEFDCVGVYMYLGLNYIQALENETFWWSNEDGSIHKHNNNLAELELDMCRYIFKIN